MIYIFLLIGSFLLTCFIMYYAKKRSLLDIPNHRSSHEHPTPHGGGVAIGITWFFGLYYLFLTANIDTNLFFALCAGAIISIVSLVDDVYQIRPSIRLLVQSGVALLGLYLLGGLEVLDFGIFEIKNSIITNIFAFFMIIWFVNVYNFLDGIDGYAGSEALFLGIAGFILFQSDIFLVLAFCVAGFLVLNWHKAKIFMGDVGSTLLGYNVAIFAIFYQNSGVSILVWFMLFGLFFFDGTLTLFRRFKNKESLHIAHKKHAYQRLVQSGLSHDKVVLLAMGVNVLLFALSYMALHVKGVEGFIFVGAMILLYGVVVLVDKRRGFQ